MWPLTYILQELWEANMPDEDLEAEDETDEGAFTPTLLRYVLHDLWPTFTDLWHTYTDLWPNYWVLDSGSAQELRCTQRH